MGLTAARFDLLDAVYRRDMWTYQSHLWRGLGVARSTVSRMLTSLERLGLVARRRDGRDRQVSLTKEGRRRVRCAFHALVASGHVGLALDSALTPSKRQWPAQRACLRARNRLATLCMRIRIAFGDEAALDRGPPHYLWWFPAMREWRARRSREQRMALLEADLNRAFG